MGDTVSRFSGRQGDYLAGRPSYPAELLEWLGALYAPPERSAAADVGFGTGKLTAQLLRAGFRVYGVEPNGDMRRAAEALPGGRSPLHLRGRHGPGHGTCGRVCGPGHRGPGLPLVRRPRLCPGVPPGPATRRTGVPDLERPQVCAGESGAGPGLSDPLSGLSRLQRRDRGGRPPYPGVFRRTVREAALPPSPDAGPGAVPPAVPLQLLLPAGGGRRIPRLSAALEALFDRFPGRGCCSSPMRRWPTRESPGRAPPAGRERSTS